MVKFKSNLEMVWKGQAQRFNYEASITTITTICTLSNSDNQDIELESQA